MEVNQLKRQLKDLGERIELAYGGFFEYDTKHERLEEVSS